jgi:hypothetical protein
MQTKFWIWKFATTANVTSDSIAKLSHSSDTDDVLLNIGKPFLSSIPPLIFTCPKEIIADYTYNNQMYPLLSCRLRDFLSKIGNVDIEFYEAELVEEETLVVHKDFFVANFINLIQAVDRENSEIDIHPIFPDSFGKIRRLTLDLSKISDAVIFRLEEYPTALIVKNSVKDAIDQHHFTGIQWVPLEEFKTLG